MAHHPSVLALVGPKPQGPTLWRVWQPFAELQRHGYPAEWTYWENDLNALIGPLFDCIVIPRVHWTKRSEERRWVKAIRRAGKVLIYEADDDVWDSIDWVYTNSDVHSSKTAAVESGAKHHRRRMLRHCHGATVTVPRLKTVAMQYTDAPIKVVPNLIDWAWWQDTLKRLRRVVPSPSVGWAGGTRRWEDIEPLSKAWSIVAERHPDVTFVVQGYLPPLLKEAVPEERLHAVPWLAFEKYPFGMGQIDVGCCPLFDCAFNRCKSPIKAMEYAACGAAVIAAPVVYQGAFDPDDGLLFASTPEEWAEQISMLLDRPDERRDRAGTFRAAVERRYSLQRHYGLWVDAWTDIYLHAMKHSVAA